MGDAEQPQKFKMCILKINAFKEKKILFYKTFLKNVKYLWIENQTK